MKHRPYRNKRALQNLSIIKQTQRYTTKKALYNKHNVIQQTQLYNKQRHTTNTVIQQTQHYTTNTALYNKTAFYNK